MSGLPPPQRVCSTAPSANRDLDALTLQRWRAFLPVGEIEILSLPGAVSDLHRRHTVRGGIGNGIVRVRPGSALAPGTNGDHRAVRGVVDRAVRPLHGSAQPLAVSLRTAPVQAAESSR